MEGWKLSMQNLQYFLSKIYGFVKLLELLFSLSSSFLHFDFFIVYFKI